MQDEFGLSEQTFGFVFGAGAIFLIGGTQLSARLLRISTPDKILMRSLMGAVAASGLFLVAAVADVGGIVVVLIPLWLVLGLSGIAMPNAPAIALSMHGEADRKSVVLVTGGLVRVVLGGRRIIKKKKHK